MGHWDDGVVGGGRGLWSHLAQILLVRWVEQQEIPGKIRARTAECGLWRVPGQWELPDGREFGELKTLTLCLGHSPGEVCVCVWGGVDLLPTKD